MRLPFRILLLLAVCPALLSSSWRPCAAEEAAPAEIAPLIERLGNVDFSVRELAADKLVALGEPALPALREAALHSGDLEVKSRARRLIETITMAACRSPSTGLRMVLVEPGEFSMGSPSTEKQRRDDETQHRVRITQPFLLGAYEVTQEEYRQVMDAEPSAFAAGGESREKVTDQDTRRFPVDSVTWYDAVEFCNRLSRRDGLPPYYLISDGKRQDGAMVKATVDVIGGLGYRLPTEAEWEYACRAGASTAYNFGAATSGREANIKFITTTLYGSSSRRPGLARTTTVGSFKPNAWGLFDMHGNVAEWCQDWYDREYYGVSPREDPPGHATGTHRVLRGGSWLATEANCRAACRFSHLPGDRHYYAGFRVARNPSHYLTAGK